MSTTLRVAFISSTIQRNVKDVSIYGNPHSKLAKWSILGEEILSWNQPLPKHHHINRWQSSPAWFSSIIVILFIDHFLRHPNQQITKDRFPPKSLYCNDNDNTPHRAGSDLPLVRSAEYHSKYNFFCCAQEKVFRIKSVSVVAGCRVRD